MVGGRTLMAQYRMKLGIIRDVVVDAYRLPEQGEDVPDAFFDWCVAVGFEEWCSGRDESIDILDHEGTGVAYTVQPGAWIIKGMDSVFRSMPHGDFIAAFEEAT